MLSIIIVLIVIAIDQLSKIACANALKLGESVEIIKGVFSIAYVENRGAAFGMLQNAQVLCSMAAITLICGRRFERRTFAKTRLHWSGYPVIGLAGARSVPQPEADG